MADIAELLLGEFIRTVDERFRLTLPQELISQFREPEGSFVLAKQRAGCLSLWDASTWQAQIEQGVDLVKRKVQAGKLSGRLSEVQLLGRLLSTGYRTVQFGGRGRLLLPEGFREFLSVEPGGDVVLVGAAICVEIWQPDSWRNYVERRMPKFRRLLDELSS